MSETVPNREAEETPVVAAVVDAVAVGEEEVVPVVVEEAALPTVGERLRAAREARGMSAADVAQALKLSPRQVEALENGDWAKLPGATFIRGFVRNYARVVQLPAESLLAELQAPPPETPRLDRPRSTSAILPEPGRAQKRDYATALAGLVFVILAVVVYFAVPADLWQTLTRESSPPAAENAAAPTPLFPPGMQPGSESAASSGSGSAIAGASRPNDAAAPLPAGASASANASSAAVATTASVESAPPAPGTTRLQLAFAQPSWVEVRDKAGQIIFSQLNQAGSQHHVDGVAPFSLVVGNAAHVTVLYQGRTVELQPRSKDDVARVTVE